MNCCTVAAVAVVVVVAGNRHLRQWSTSSGSLGTVYSGDREGRKKDTMDVFEDRLLVSVATEQLHY
jgi:hypothetical protein